MNSICKCNTGISSDPPCRSYILLNNWQTYSDLRHHANISLITAGSPPGICSINPRTSTRLQNHKSKASAHDITAKVRITQSSRAINTRWHRYNRGRPWSSTCVTLAMTTPIPKIYGRSHSPVGFFSDSEGHTLQIPMHFKISEWLLEQVKTEFCRFNSNEETPAMPRDRCSSPKQASRVFLAYVCPPFARSLDPDQSYHRQCKKLHKTSL